MNDPENKLNKHYKHFKISHIQDICEQLPTINQLKDTFHQLNTLNSILAKSLPEHLTPFCRIGSIDRDKNQVILFITDQQVYHVIRNFSEHIIQIFYNHGFHFNSIITKVAKLNTSHALNNQDAHIMQQNKRKDIIHDAKHKESLAKLAIALGKPEIILDVDD